MPAPCDRLLRGEHLAERGDERLERADLAEVRERLRAIGVVEAENRRLREEIRRTPAGRVIGVAFDLRRPALVALDEQADAAPANGMAVA